MLCAREEYTADRMPEISVKNLSGRMPDRIAKQNW